MSKPNREYPTIHDKVYQEMKAKGEAYTGYVIQEDNRILFITSENVILSMPENMQVPVTRLSNFNMGHGVKYHESQTHLICVQDKTRIARGEDVGQKLKIEIESTIVKNNAKTQLIFVLRDYFQKEEFRYLAEKGSTLLMDPSQINMDVSQPRTPNQKKYAELKKKINENTLTREDFPKYSFSSISREIDTYFACFDPLDPNNYYFWNGAEEQKGIGQPGTVESFIPIWGSGRAAVDHFQNGSYGWGIGYTALAITDVFLVRTIVTGIGKGAWKLGSHTWPATRSWALRRGWTEPYKPIHHWLLSQEFLKKYNLQWLGNQPWNWKKMPSDSFHMRFGHGKNFKGDKAGNVMQQLWFGTPNWPKYTIGGYGGRPIMNILDDE